MKGRNINNVMTGLIGVMIISGIIACRNRIQSSENWPAPGTKVLHGSQFEIFFHPQLTVYN